MSRGGCIFPKKGGYRDGEMKKKWGLIHLSVLCSTMLDEINQKLCIKMIKNDWQRKQKQDTD